MTIKSRILGIFKDKELYLQIFKGKYYISIMNQDTFKIETLEEDIMEFEKALEKFEYYYKKLK